MQRRPHVSWPLARAVERLLADPGPGVSRPDAVREVAALRAAARRAGDLAVEHSGLGGAAAAEVVVVDRPGWSRRAAVMADDLLGRLPLEEQPAGPRRTLAGIGYGLLAGISFVAMGRGLLGQYDPWSERLMLVAPSIVEVRRGRGLDADDLRLWVSLHEQTHAVQFNSAPWLLGHVEKLIASLSVDDPSPAEVTEGIRGGRGVASLLVTAEGQRHLDALTATMTLLEGHADLVADAAGAVHVPSVRRLRATFARPAAGTGWRRLIPGLDKGLQYRDGLAFCQHVGLRAGLGALTAAFAGPANLPTVAEITDPDAWLRRIHG